METTTTKKTRRMRKGLVRINGPALRRIRRAQDITQVQLAVATGIKHGHLITQYERGGTKACNPATLLALARALNVQPSELTLPTPPAPPVEPHGMGDGTHSPAEQDEVIAFLRRAS